MLEGGFWRVEHELTCFFFLVAIESRVARIKARVAELTGNIEPTSAGA